jgi:hypothetical protein
MTLGQHEHTHKTPPRLSPKPKLQTPTSPKPRDTRSASSKEEGIVKSSLKII